MQKRQNKIALFPFFDQKNGVFWPLFFTFWTSFSTKREKNQKLLNGSEKNDFFWKKSEKKVYMVFVYRFSKNGFQIPFFQKLKISCPKNDPFLTIFGHFCTFFDFLPKKTFFENRRFLPNPEKTWKNTVFSTFSKFFSKGSKKVKWCLLTFFDSCLKKVVFRNYEKNLSVFPTWIFRKNDDRKTRFFALFFNDFLKNLHPFPWHFWKVPKIAKIGQKPWYRYPGVLTDF